MKGLHFLVQQKQFSLISGWLPQKFKERALFLPLLLKFAPLQLKTKKQGLITDVRVSEFFSSYITS